MRRVSVWMEIGLAGASWIPRVAESEAVERVRLAVELAGGVSNLLGVSSAVVRRAPGDALAVRARRGDPE